MWRGNIPAGKVLGSVSHVNQLVSPVKRGEYGCFKGSLKLIIISLDSQDT